MVSKRLWRGVKNYLSPSLSLCVFIALAYSPYRYFRFLMAHSACTECLLSWTLCDINSANIDLCSCFDFVLFSAHSHTANGHREKCGLYCIVICSPFKSIWFVSLAGRSVQRWTWFQSVILHLDFFAQLPMARPASQRLDLYAKNRLLFKTHLHQFMKLLQMLNMPPVTNHFEQ